MRPSSLLGRVLLMLLLTCTRPASSSAERDEEIEFLSDSLADCKISVINHANEWEACQTELMALQELYTKLQDSCAAPHDPVR